MSVSLQSKFDAIRKSFRSSLIERNDEIDVSLCALVCQEHALFVGAPGTAKSLLADSICQWIGGEYFHVLVGRFTTTEELFGPISLAGLKNEKYVRVTDGRLPRAEVAFIDEIFKSSSAILNTLLQVLNERVFFNGTNVQCPLRLCVAASNEWPAEKELSALFDRFLFRKAVRPVGSSRGVKNLLWKDDLTPKIVQPVTVKEVDQAHKEAALLEVGKDARDAFEQIYRRLQAGKIPVGDRRLRKAVGAARANAWLAGHAEVEVEDLSILAHVLWSHQDQADTAADIVREIASPNTQKIAELTNEVSVITQGLNEETPLQEIVAADRKLVEVIKTLQKIGSEAAKELAEVASSERTRIRGLSLN